MSGRKRNGRNVSIAVHVFFWIIFLGEGKVGVSRGGGAVYPPPFLALFQTDTNSEKAKENSDRTELMIGKGGEKRKRGKMGIINAEK